MKLTKQAIDRLQSSPIEVKLYNGTFNKALVSADFARHRFELVVTVTHPMLKIFHNSPDRQNLIFWKGYRGIHIDIPEELQELVEQMKNAAKMPDDEARALQKSIAAAVLDFNQAMGFNT